MTQLKKVFYRGGIICIDLPEDWRETTEQSGGTAFLQDRADAGALRLNVITFSSEGTQPSAEMVTTFITKDAYEPFQTGLAIKRSTIANNEQGQALEMRTWQIACPVPPYDARLAVFTYTYPTSQAQNSVIQHDLEMLERSIDNAEFSREPGTFEDPALSAEFTPLAPDDLAMLDAEREFATSVLEVRFPGTQLSGEPDDLEILQRIFEGGPYSDSAEGELVALGTTFGDLLARALGLDWVCYTDASGGDIGLRYRESSIVMFPREMIVKRVERNEVVDLPHLYNEIIRHVKETIASGNYR